MLHQLLLARIELLRRGSLHLGRTRIGRARHQPEAESPVGRLPFPGDVVLPPLGQALDPVAQEALGPVRFQRDRRVGGASGYSDPRAFLAAFERVIHARGWRNVRSPAALLEQWASFVGECQRGYQGTIYECDDDLAVREQIQAILDDPEAASYPEAWEWVERVHAVDAEFRHLLKPLTTKPGKRPWWQCGIPAFGGAEFAKDVQAKHGVRVEVRDV